ncbi:MAG: LptF/LptG family permease, partial [Holosporaceae bacterium]|nr:LptF/LptG family permease [Holosporaceae bacterium]
MNSMLFKYMFVMQTRSTIFMSSVIFSLIALFDFAEVIRMFPPDSLADVLICIKLALLRSPHTFCEILHYIYFVAITFSLLNLIRSNQITILKASGRSPLQILYPFVWFAFCTASIWL